VQAGWQAGGLSNQRQEPLVLDMYGRCVGVGDWRGAALRVREQRPLGVLVQQSGRTGKSGNGELRNGSEAQSDMPCDPSS
jgi:hypothetical protein